MPRAFLIKKKQQCARSGQSLSRMSWSDEESSDVHSMDESDSSRFLPRFGPLVISHDPKGPYDLSMKPKSTDENSDDSENRHVYSPDLSYSHRSVHPPATLVAPKPIKPTPKSAEEIAACRPQWPRQLPPSYHPYSYPAYPYPSRPEPYPYGSSGTYAPTRTSPAPPPLVPLNPSNNPGVKQERYSPSSVDRYSPYEVAPSPRAPSPTKTAAVSPLYWLSDGQDSGLASSSPSPSSEDGEVGQKANQTRYQCPDCSKSYSTYSGLSKHRLMHCTTQAQKSFSCKYCDKVYVSLGALKMHIRTHTLPCKCKLCGKAFSRPWLLQGHIRTHTGEKPFSCPHCSRAFADRSNLRAHLQTHSEIKKYRCKSCSKTFSRMSLLLKHEDGGCTGAGGSASPVPAEQPVA